MLYEELNNRVDIHQANQDAFKLPDRIIAKILKFRIIYGGNEYSFVNDPDFASVSTSLKYWKKVIDKYFEKYHGMANWHNKIIKEVSKTSCLTTPFGRKLEWDLNKYGSFKLPITEIKNYPVQSTGADIVSIARCSLYRRWRNSGIEGKLVTTVHDSIVLDVPKKSVTPSIDLLINVFNDLPSNINRIFGINFDLETRVEVSIGANMYELREVST